MTIEANSRTVEHPPTNERPITLETPKSLRIIIPRKLISKILARCGDPIEEWTPAHYVKQTADALGKTREVILAPWLEHNQTVIHTPTLAAPLNRDEISSYLRILLHRRKLCRMVLKKLEGGKKVIISSTPG